MEYVKKLEKTVLGWLKNVPHLPASARKWLGDNVWWIVLVGVIFSAIAVLVAISGLFALIAALSAVSSVYYVTGFYTGFDLLRAVVSLVFLATIGIVLALSINPLKAKQKKGWVLLFLSLLINALSVVVTALLSFSVFGFIGGILFGAIGILIGAYFISEIHGEFEHKLKAKIKKS